VCVEWAGITLPMYDIGLQLLGVRDDSKLMYALCSITHTDATSHSRAKHVCGLLSFTARRYACAVYPMALCPSVCPSQVGVLSKQLNVSSCKQLCMPAYRGTNFMVPKIWRNFYQYRVTQRGRRIHVRWGKLRLLTIRFISKTVGLQYRHAVFMNRIGSRMC